MHSLLSINRAKLFLSRDDINRLNDAQPGTDVTLVGENGCELDVMVSPGPDDSADNTESKMTSYVKKQENTRRYRATKQLAKKQSKGKENPNCRGQSRSPDMSSNVFDKAGHEQQLKTIESEEAREKAAYEYLEDMLGSSAATLFTKGQSDLQFRIMMKMKEFCMFVSTGGDDQSHMTPAEKGLDLAGQHFVAVEVNDEQLEAMKRGKVLVKSLLVGPHYRVEVQAVQGTRSLYNIYVGSHIPSAFNINMGYVLQAIAKWMLRNDDVEKMDVLTCVAASAFSSVDVETSNLLMGTYTDIIKTRRDGANQLSDGAGKMMEVLLDSAKKKDKAVGSGKSTPIKPNAKKY